MSLRKLWKWHSKKSKKDETESSEKAPDDRSESRPESLVASPTATMPTVVVTDLEEAEDDIDTAGEMSLKTRRQSLGSKKDSGIMSTGPSSSTLSPEIRPRSLTASSGDSSVPYYTPPSSIGNDSSPIGSEGAPPQFPAANDRELASGSSNAPLEPLTKVQLEALLMGINAGIDWLKDRVGSIEMRIGHLPKSTVSTETQTTEFRPSASLPDISELPGMSCDQRVILWLMRKVTEWKFLARWLRLEDSDISRIETDNPNNDREQCYQMFLRWKAVDPENYTYPVLGEALRKESQELYNDYVKEVHRVESQM